jgi:UPF0755 protein
MSPRDVLDSLVRGAPEDIAHVTLPEGLNMKEVFARMDSAAVASAEDLEELARDPEYLRSLNIAADTLEGYLFPDTYRFKVPTPAKAVLSTLVAQHRRVWDRIRTEHAAGVTSLNGDLGWTDHEILILASIVVKEAVVDEERARIAQVFINRLVSKAFRPKLLQTDPSVRYGCIVPPERSAPCQAWDPTQRLRRAQLDDAANLYNTYQHEGLPPGPIGNPGAKSLRATVAPDGSPYLFFVSKNDGTHVFASSAAEHQRNVSKYQR